MPWRAINELPQGPAWSYEDLSLGGGRIVLVPAKRHPRAGWADAAKHIAEGGDDALVWPDFGNTGDADLKW